MSMNYDEAVAFLNNVLTDDVPWCDAPIVNPEFDNNDIRSRVKIGWYVFAGGYVSSDKDAYPNCQGVVGFINDDPNAEKGNRVKVVLRHQKYFIKWCEKEIYTNVTDDDNGRENTRRLLEFGKKAGVKFPAMEFAQNYAFDGVKPGEAYVPARDELKELSKNSYIINEVLRKIDGSFDDWQWSTSEYGNYTVWHVYSGNGIVSNYHKNLSGAVSCLLAY